MKIKGIIMVIAGLCFFVSGSLSAQEKRPITPQDCVTVRNILPIDETASWAWAVKISPDGGSVAYLVQSPNLQTNINDVDLYVRAVPQDPSAPSRHLLSGKITDFVWSSGGRSLVVLANENGRRVLEIIDVVTAEKQLLIRANTDIEEFTIDKSGDTIVYTTKRESTSGGDHDPTAQDIARGYRIPFGQESESGWPHGSVFLTNRIHGVWTTPRLLEFTSPLSGQRMTSLAYSANEPIQPALSPDGSKLLVVYEDSSTTMPDEWSSSGMKKFLNTTAGTIQAFHLVLMYNITAGETSVPLKSPFVSGRPLWAPDSQSFLIAGAPEVGSAEEKEEVKDGSLGHSSGALLFSVGSEVKKVSIISRRLAYVGEVALHIGKDGSVLARVERESAGTITRFTYQNGEWKQTESFKVPLPLTIASIAVNEHYVIGSFSDLTTPPELFEYQRDNKKVEIFEKLNPQFDHLTIAQPVSVDWKTPEGFNVKGTLVLPPGYEKGKRYPLVIQTKPYISQFVCSLGNYPSFAPQPLANAGIMYLAPGALPGHEISPKLHQKESDYTPKGYPSGMSEPAFDMAIWDSAVKSLSEQGLIDENKVGIIGFSRTGWYTEFILAHSKTRYRAATVADNVEFSLGEYWMSHDASTLRTEDDAYGGPPYGATLKNWLDYSVSFNLDKFHTPLLMEEMGYGLTQVVNPLMPPIGLSESYEVFTGLNRLSKPVELYFYPNEGHTPDHPQARLATMQRNVDWYRFWLQDYERPNPEDPDQYKRWRHLQELQDAGDKAAIPLQSDTSTPH